MRTGLAFSVSCLLIVAVLTGCALVRHESREAWRGEAEKMCMRSGNVPLGGHVQKMSRVNGPGVCGIDRPLKVGATPYTQVAITPGATLNCPMAATMDRWVSDVVQPAALTWFGSPVVSMKNAASYGCRTRNHRPGAKLSEHAFGNALDIAAFTLANGRTVALDSGWRGARDEQGFLRQVFLGACERFRTVLGPGSDGAHEDHFHFDLARHSAKWPSYCRPRAEAVTMPQWTPPGLPPAGPEGIPIGPRKW